MTHRDARVARHPLGLLHAQVVAVAPLGRAAGRGTVDLGEGVVHGGVGADEDVEIAELAPLRAWSKKGRLVGVNI